MDSIKIAKDFYIPLDNIRFYCGYANYKMKQIIKELKKEKDRVIDLSGHKKAASAVFLKTGEIILTNVNISTIAARINTGKSEE